jgi:hypothetical protein
MEIFQIPRVDFRASSFPGGFFLDRTSKIERGVDHRAVGKAESGRRRARARARALFCPEHETKESENTSREAGE